MTDAEAVRRCRVLLDPELRDEFQSLDSAVDEALNILSLACQENRPSFEARCLAKLEVNDGRARP